MHYQHNIAVVLSLAVGFFLFCACSPSEPSFSRELREKNLRRPGWTEQNIGIHAPIARFRVTSDVGPQSPYFPGGNLVGTVNGNFDLEMPGTWVRAYDDYGSFKTTYFYVDRNNKYWDGHPLFSRYFKQALAYGAQTTSPSGSVLAEARLLSILPSDEYQKAEFFQIEEFHYKSDGQLSFYCKSDIEIKSGNKIREYEAVGKKASEFYFEYHTFGP